MQIFYFYYIYHNINITSYSYYLCVLKIEHKTSSRDLQPTCYHLTCNWLSICFLHIKKPIKAKTKYTAHTTGIKTSPTIMYKIPLVIFTISQNAQQSIFF